MIEFDQNNLYLVLIILDKNDVRYNFEIENYFLSPAASIKNQELARDFFDILYDLSIDGINNGFDTNKKKNILELTNQIVFQNKPAAKEDKNYNDSVKVRDKIRNKNSSKVSLKQGDNIIIDFGAFVNRTLQAVKVFNKSYKLNENQQLIIDEGVKKLEEILNKLHYLKDYSSLDAKTAYKKSYDKIVVWSNLVVNMELYKPTNSYLDDALKIVAGWINLVKYNPTKEELLPEDPISDLDRVKDVLQILTEQFKSAKEELINIKNNYKELEDQVIKLNNDILELEAQKSRLTQQSLLIVSNYENGSITKEAGLSDLKQNETLMKNVDIQLSNIRSNLEPLNHVLDQKRILIDNIDAQFKLIENMAKEPLRFYCIIKSECIDMAIIFDYITVKLSNSDDIELASKQLEKLNSYARQKENEDKALLAKLEAEILDKKKND